MGNVTLPGNDSNWTAIGTDSASFHGNINGNGYTISKLRINTAKDEQGMFGHLEGDSVINLGLVNANISAVIIPAVLQAHSWQETAQP